MNFVFISLCFIAIFAFARLCVRLQLSPIKSGLLAFSLTFVFALLLVLFKELTRTEVVDQPLHAFWLQIGVVLVLFPTASGLKTYIEVRDA